MKKQQREIKRLAAHIDEHGIRSEKIILVLREIKTDTLLALLDHYRDASSKTRVAITRAENSIVIAQQKLTEILDHISSIRREAVTRTEEATIWKKSQSNTEKS